MEDTKSLRGQVSVTKNTAGDARDNGYWWNNKWQVVGPGSERQIFTSKKEANLYAKCRRNSKDHAEAGKKFLLAD